MHKQLFNEATVALTIVPTGPILIKAGEGAADPTKPDMNFVRTTRDGQETIYLPGSSLKGVLRSHCERLARTVQGKRRLACDPLGKESCSNSLEGKKLSSREKYTKSCFVCQIFGNTSLASHFRISDAYPLGKCHTEERNGVAIDRVFGSVAHGPFNYETVTAGNVAVKVNTFTTTLHLKNFALAQIGLLSLALRDLSAERIRLGFGKSRGLGTVTAQVDDLIVSYPLCELKDGRFQLLGGRELGPDTQLFGIGVFAKGEGYGYSETDAIPLDELVGYRYSFDELEGVKMRAPRVDDRANWESLGRKCVDKWRDEVARAN